MHVTIASDHAGFNLKQLLIPHLLSLDISIQDMGPGCGTESCDYPDFAQQVCAAVLSKGGLGVLICGTGIGMSMAANRLPGIRAALCTSEFQARYARKHNNANVLCQGGRITGDALAKEILDQFLAADFEGGRHLGRIRMFDSKA